MTLKMYFCIFYTLATYTIHTQSGRKMDTFLLQNFYYILTYNRDNQDQYQYVFTLGIVKGHEMKFSELVFVLFWRSKKKLSSLEKKCLD